MRMREEHGAELEAKRKAESRVRAIESQLASHREDLEEVARQLEAEQKENSKVREREREREREIN